MKQCGEQEKNKQLKENAISGNVFSGEEKMAKREGEKVISSQFYILGEKKKHKNKNWHKRSRIR